jgi:hypothetical protein
MRGRWRKLGKWGNQGEGIRGNMHFHHFHMCEIE